MWPRATGRAPALCGFFVPVALLVGCAALAPVGLADEPARTKLALSATATREVQQDTLVGVLAAHAEAATASAAQATVNRLMAAAIEKARAVKSVRAASGGYRVFQDYDKDGRARRWIAEQDLRLTGTEAAPLLELVGALQAVGLNVNGLSYQLSAEARRAVEDELTVEAIQTLRNRAERVATSMGMRVQAIESLQVGQPPGEPPIRPMLRATVAEAAPMSPPVALPDLETVSAGVSAELVLVPR
jgi:predicted secreted protein